MKLGGPRARSDLTDHPAAVPREEAKFESGPELEPIERAVCELEHKIRLLDRVLPTNAAAERSRLLRTLVSGRVAAPAFTYAPTPETPVWQRQLGELSARLESIDHPAARWFAARVEELLVEAELLLARGTPQFQRLACQRYVISDKELEDSEVLAHEWLREPPSQLPADPIVSDDRRDPRSLWCVLERRIQQSGFPIRLVVSAELSSAAAAGDGFVAMRSNARYSAEAAERIAQHELLAHVFPRFHARQQRIGLLRVGVRGSGEEEEGRALLIEQRGGYLDNARRRELALRHLAASAVRSGADFEQLVRLLEAHGSSLEAACDTAFRALRGGGLAREIAYIPAFLRVSEAFSAAPELERWFERGRATLAFSRALAGGPPPVR